MKATKQPMETVLSAVLQSEETLRKVRFRISPEHFRGRPELRDIYEVVVQYYNKTGTMPGPSIASSIKDEPGKMLFYEELWNSLSKTPVEDHELEWALSQLQEQAKRTMLGEYFTTGMGILLGKDPGRHGTDAAWEFAGEEWEALNRIRSAGKTIPASDIMPQAVEWLWEGRIPFGMVTLIAGPPKVGKSTILYDKAAEVSKKGGTVLLVTAEDHLAMVARPRLQAAGADLARCHFWTAELSLPESVGEVRAKMQDLEASLLVLDPLNAFIGDRTDTNTDHKVRRVLAPLTQLAEDLRVSVLLVKHTNKGQGTDPLMRIGGSVGFTAAARSILLVAKDPNDPGRHILAVVGSNIGPEPPPLAFKVVGAALHESQIMTSRIEWLGEVPDVDPSSLLASQKTDGAHGEAVNLLQEMLSDQEVPASQVEAAAEAQGISRATLYRARKSVGVPSKRKGFGPGSAVYWGPYIPQGPSPETETYGVFGDGQGPIPQEELEKLLEGDA
jgi:hypothetical protein